LILAAALVAVVLLAAVAVASIGRLAKTAIETVGPRVLQVPVSVDDVDVSIRQGSFSFSGFRVGNPEGFSSPNSFAVARARVQADLRTLLSDVVVVPLVEVDKPEVTLEFDGTRTNLGEILKTLQALRQREAEGLEEPGRKVRIGLIRITGARVSVAGLPGGQGISFPLPDVTIEDLQAGGEPRSPAEVATRMLESLYAETVKAGQKLLPAEQLGALKAQTEQFAREAGSMAAETLEEGQKAIGGKLGEAAGKVQDRLKGILK